MGPPFATNARIEIIDYGRNVSRVELDFPATPDAYDLSFIGFRPTTTCSGERAITHFEVRPHLVAYGLPSREESATSVPYEVLKRIKGRDYVYRVESVADAGTGRLRRRWTYLGRYDGATIRYARRRIAGEARLRFTRAIVELLETRDVDFLTVDVIARAANSSRATFYRQFADRECALEAALEHLTATAYAALPVLDAPRRGGERDALRAWLDALVVALVDRRVPTRRVLAAPGASAWRSFVAERWRDRLAKTLEPYLDGLRAGDVVRCEDPALVASGIVCLIEGLVARTIAGEAESVDRVALVDIASIAERLVFGP